MTQALIEELRARGDDARLPSPARARLIRIEAGVTQQRLADELDVIRITVARWENGSREPRGELRRRYAALLRELEELI
jgi:DNA-binding XRE family transcriptional regulator